MDLEQNKNQEETVLNIDETIYRTSHTKKYSERPHQDLDEQNCLKAFLPGLIKEVKVKAGDVVKKGQCLVVLEAMKMFNELSVNQQQTIAAVNVKAGDIVKKGQILVKFK